MKIAYNPITETALGTAPNNNDIIFDLKGLNIFAKGTKFKGTDTTYSVFKKNTSSSGGGYNGLVPVPSYTTTNVRYLREDGTWQDLENIINKKADKATTLAGYGITDAVTINTNQTITGTKTFTGTTTSGNFNTSGKYISNFASGSWINSVTNSVLTCNYTTYGGIFSAPVKSGRITLSTYPSNSNLVYLGYASSAQISAGTNNFNRQATWNADNGYLTVDGYVKNGSSDLYVLLGGGGHKLISDFATSSSLGNYLPLTGGTLTGALNFANNIWNKVGDDVAIGDCNNAGILGIKALNSAIPGIKFFNNSGTAVGILTSNGGTLQWKGVNIFSNFSANNTLTQLTIGGITKSLTIPYSTKAGQLNTSVYSTGSLANLTNSGYLYYAGGNNTVSDKPSGVGAFGLFTIQAADSYYGQILMSSNTATGLYWRTAQIFSGGWRTLLDSSNYISYIKKIGTDTVGSASKGIYLNAGVPTALSANVGATNKPVYMSAGNIVPCSYTFGNASGNAPINNGTLCTNLNADMLDGKHLSQIGEYGYIMTKYTIDASSLDENTYYPVTFSIGKIHNVRIECIVSLDSGTVPSWSTHSWGFSVRKVWEVNGSGWGTSYINRRILISDYKFADSDPVRYVSQLSNPSIEYVYVRGGGKYFFYTSHNITPVLRTSTYTESQQSVSPTTTVPGDISRNVAYITDNVASATRLQTARTINGTSFNGTANIITTTWGTTRTISLTGAVTGSVSTNGGSNIVINTSYGTDNITSLDSRYVKKVGDTMTGNLTTQGRFYIQQSGRTDKCCLFQSATLEDQCGIILLDSSGTENILRLTTTNLTWRNSIIWHAGNDGSGSGLDADLLDGKHASSFSLTTHTHSSIKIQDNRSTVMLPNNMGTQIVNTFFNMQDNMPNTQWWSGLHFTGWTSGYAAWQLAGPAGQSPYSDALYFRSGINSTWNSWKKILFNTDLTWENILNKPSSFTPSAHTHNYLVSRGRVTAESGTALPALSGLSMSEVYSNGYPTTYGNVITLNGGGQGQLLIGWSSSSGGNAPAYIRSKRDVDSASWSSWAQLYTTVNKPSWDDILNKPTTFTPASHEHDHLRSFYTGSGGKIAPATIGTNNAFIRMSKYNNDYGYQDWLYMNAYTQLDVPYATAIGVSKKAVPAQLDVPYATAIGVSKKAVPAAYIMSGPNSGDTSSWVIRQLATFNDLTWTNIQNKPSSFTPSTHTHTISQISDLNENWDTLLKNTPPSQVTRWPSWNEVTDKPTSFTPATHTHSYITVNDTRNINGTPTSYSGKIIEGEFKTLTSISSPSGLGGIYAGLLTFSPWNDSTGGHIYQMAFGYNSSLVPILHIRSAFKDNTTWGSWKTIASLEVSQTWTAYQDFKSGAGNSGSDMRFKSNVKEISSILEDIKDLSIIEYDWNKKGEEKHTFGVNATQLQQKGRIFKSIVHEREDKDKTKWVEYDRIGVIALKGLQEYIKYMEERITKLELRIKELESK